MSLTAFKSHGVEYSDQYFTEETIEWLLRSPKEKLLEEMPPEVAPVAHTPASAFAAAWAELADDPEFQQAIKEIGYSEEQGRADFEKAVATPVSDEIDGALSESLTIDYQARVEDGNHVHLLNGERILVIPAGLESAEAISANGEAILYGVFLVIDVLGIVAAAAGVKVVVRKEKLAMQMLRQRGRIEPFLGWVTDPAAALKLNQLSKSGKRLDLILTVLKWLHGSTNPTKVVMAFLGSLSPLDKALAVVQLIASIALLIGSAGASFTLKLVALAASIAVFIADVVGFVNALAKR